MGLAAVLTRGTYYLLRDVGGRRWYAAPCWNELRHRRADRGQLHRARCALVQRLSAHQLIAKTQLMPILERSRGAARAAPHDLTTTGESEAGSMEMTERENDKRMENAGADASELAACGPRASRPATVSEGFTLIELMVVVLIIGILIAIALPTFLGARQRAEARAAQSSARNALVAAKKPCRPPAGDSSNNASSVNTAGTVDRAVPDLPGRCLHGARRSSASRSATNGATTQPGDRAGRDGQLGNVLLPARRGEHRRHRSGGHEVRLDEHGS